MTQAEQLREYNAWRRGDDTLQQPDPKELGELLDGVADRLEVLELEHTEFFDRWHDERRKREALEMEIEESKDALRKAALGVSAAISSVLDIAKG